MQFYYTLLGPTVEAVALQNLPQTLRGRERSKKGYAAGPLLLVTSPRMGTPTRFLHPGGGRLRMGSVNKVISKWDSAAVGKWK